MGQIAVRGSLALRDVRPLSLLTLRPTSGTVRVARGVQTHNPDGCFITFGLSRDSRRQAHFSRGTCVGRRSLAASPEHRLPTRCLPLFFICPSHASLRPRV